MRAEPYGSAVLPTEGSPEILYSLLCDESGSIGRMQCELYGVQAEMGGESVSKPRLTASRTAVERLLDSLVRGAVPPVAVGDVVEDWLAS